MVAAVDSSNPISKIDQTKSTIFLEDGIAWTYLAIFMGTFLLFWLVIYAHKYYFDNIRKEEEYIQLGEQDRWYYV